MADLKIIAPTFWVASYQYHSKQSYTLLNPLTSVDFEGLSGCRIAHFSLVASLSELNPLFCIVTQFPLCSHPIFFLRGMHFSVWLVQTQIRILYILYVQMMYICT